MPIWNVPWHLRRKGSKKERSEVQSRMLMNKVTALFYIMQVF